MTRNSLLKLFSIAAILMLLVVACGDDDDDGADATNTSPAAGGAPTETRDTGGGTEAEGGGDGGDDLIAMGQGLYNEQGCNACHSVDGSSGVGPTWQGLVGRETPLESGETITADEAYITESIHDPGAKVHEGFQPIMPPFPNLSDEQISAIIAYMESLS